MSGITGAARGAPPWRWILVAAVALVSTAGVGALLLVRAHHIRAAKRRGRVFRVSLPNGTERTVIVRPARRKSASPWEWDAW